MMGRTRVIPTVFRTVVATLLVHLLVFALVVGTVNPLGTLWGHWFPTATPVTRMTKMKLFAAWERQAPVRGLILGASRSMLLAPTAFSQARGLRYFNYALSAGTLEDVRIVMQLMDEQHVHLSEITLGVDAQMLTRYPPAHELTTDWEFARRLEGSPPTSEWKFKHGVQLAREAMTPRFIRAVGTSVMAALQHKEPLHHISDDGYLAYPLRDKQIAAGHYPRESMIKRCTRVIVDSLLVQYPSDPRRMAMLNAILDHARSEGIRVTLWYTPDHPDLIRTAALHPALDAWLRGVPDSLQRVAAVYGATFVNLHTIDTFDGDPNDYYDCAHFGHANEAKITAQLLAADRLGAGPALAHAP